MSTGTLGLLYLRTWFLVDRLAIPGRPYCTQEDSQTRDDLLPGQLLGKPIGNRPGWEQNRQCSQLLLHVLEDLLDRHRIHGHLLAGRHVGPYHWQQIVEHQAE